MKIIKTFALVSVLTIGLTTSVFASWWNPFTWHWFKKQTPVTTQQVVENNTSSDTSTTENKPDELKDWKTYTNTKYGFEVRYPSEYNPVEIGNVIHFQKRNDEINWGITISVNTLTSKDSCDSKKYTDEQKVSMAGDSITSRQIYLDSISKEFSQLSVVYNGRTGLSTYIPTKDCQSSRKMIVISASENLLTQYNQLLSTFKFISVLENKKETTVITNDGGITFGSGTILFAKDSNGKKWTVDYKYVKFYESFIRDGQEISKVGDFNSWLESHKYISSPNYDGPGIPGVVKITGIIDEKGVIQASKIIQHVQ